MSQYVEVIPGCQRNAPLTDTTRTCRMQPEISSFHGITKDFIVNVLVGCVQGKPVGPVLDEIK